jgi:hypothetical protein
MTIKWSRSVLIVILIVSLVGCSTTRAIEPDGALETYDNRITVYLKDARIVVFEPGEYTIQEDVDAAYIRGNGRQSIDGKPGDTPFRGTITRDEVERILITKPTGFSNVMIPLTLGAMALLGVLIYGLANADWSGI